MFDAVTVGDNLYELELDTVDYARQHRFPILYGVAMSWFSFELHVILYSDQPTTTAIIKMS